MDKEIAVVSSLQGPPRRPLRLVAVALFALAAPLGCDPQVSGPQFLSSYTVPGDMTFPEGIAVHADRREYYTGSLSQGTLFRGRFDTTAAEVFAAAGADGRTFIAGMNIDRQRNRLFAVGGPTGLAFVYDITNGQLLGKFDTPIPPSSDPNNPSNFLNDVILTANGDAYITDSVVPTIYRIRTVALGQGSTTQRMESWLALNGTTFAYQSGSDLLSSINANGIVLTADGRYLLIVQTNTGKLFRIDTDSQAIAQVTGVSIPGGDGMILDGNTLYAIHNDTTPVLRFTLSADFSSGTAAALPSQPTGLKDPTTAALLDGTLFIVNSQVSGLFFGGPVTPPFTITSFKLP